MLLTQYSQPNIVDQVNYLNITTKCIHKRKTKLSMYKFIK